MNCAVVRATSAPLSRRCATTARFDVSVDSDSETSRHSVEIHSQVNSQVIHLPHCQHFSPALEVSTRQTNQLMY